MEPQDAPTPLRRSALNRIVQETLDFFNLHKFCLPVWSTWTPEQWRAAVNNNEDKFAEIREAELGWDVTDFQQGRFDEFGLVLFTIRNGCLANGNPTKKMYAEKLMMVRPKQKTPMHFHFSKMEDIICRGGAPLVMQLYNADPKNNDELDKETPVQISVDGVVRTVSAGGTIALHPGESVTLPQKVYHAFWADESCNEPTLIGEVSLVNDDNTDNRFADLDLPRFPTIVEDEPPRFLLCKDYAKFWK